MVPSPSKNGGREAGSTSSINAAGSEHVCACCPLVRWERVRSPRGNQVREQCAEMKAYLNALAIPATPHTQRPSYRGSRFLRQRRNRGERGGWQQPRVCLVCKTILGRISRYCESGLALPPCFVCGVEKCTHLRKEILCRHVYHLVPVACVRVRKCVYV